MILKRFFLLLLVAVAAQGAWFAYHYSDLLALRSSASDLAASPDHFRTVAAQAMQRPELTRHHLETLADAAKITGDIEIEVTARQRLWESYSSEQHLGLQLADALRRAKRLDDAERVYQQLLAPTASARTQP